MHNGRWNPTSLDEEVLFCHLSVQRRLGLRIKHQILQINHQPGSSQTLIRPKARTRDGEKRNPDLQRGLGGDGLVRGGEEREAHGLVALEVDLGSLEPREPAQQVVELPLLDVEGEPRDEDGADLVGRGGAGSAGACPFVARFMPQLVAAAGLKGNRSRAEQSGGRAILA